MSDSSSEARLVFWLGTEAELIKVIPVLVQLEMDDTPFEIYSTSQNEIESSSLWTILKKRPTILKLSSGPKKKTTLSLVMWFIKTLFQALVMIPKNNDKYLVVHGDTISTLMGAIVGRILKFNVSHIEAGLRSFRYFDPFPEEICRVITSFLAQHHFCSSAEAVHNLRSASGHKVNTEYNTLIDSLTLYKDQYHQPSSAVDEKYFVFVLHRQENLYNESFVREIIKIVISRSARMKCYFILHEPTKVALERLGLLNEVLSSSRIVAVPRQNYFAFMSLLDNSEFLVTDGGSNQEESFYMGLPCIILRNATERSEGLQSNAILSKLDFKVISKFFDEYKIYRKPPIVPLVKPSLVIARYLKGIL